MRPTGILMTLLVLACASAFVSVPPGARPRRCAARALKKDEASSEATPRTWNAGNKVLAGADARGRVFLGLVLLVNVWSFSVPPEIRRAHVCTTSVVGQKNGYSCVSFRDWRQSVTDYYAQGGGVHFDFSVDPASK
ncbi:hypothetical protein M885DRAFT_509278 [Pelagophyceae sp. CCMP2097]|nr:hypothetical protein M885DRAFT_509278 [Pelagophyceae sp. CCMP2097]